MAKRAWCSDCNGYVMLTPEGMCPGGHPKPCLRAIEEVVGSAVPAVPVRRAPVSVTPAYAAESGTLIGALDENRFAGESGSAFSASPPPSYAAQPSRPAWQPGAAEAAPSSKAQAKWIIPLAMVGSIVFAFVLAMASPLAGLVIGGFLLGTLLSAATLWVGMKLTGESGSILALLAISAVCGCIQLVPYIGGLMAFIVMFALIARWMRIPVWPDAVLMVVVSRAVAIFGALVLVGMILRF